MKCIECGHDTINKNRTYVANLENCVIIIKMFRLWFVSIATKFIILMKYSSRLKK